MRSQFCPLTMESRCRILCESALRVNRGDADESNSSVGSVTLPVLADWFSKYAASVEEKAASTPAAEAESPPASYPKRKIVSDLKDATACLTAAAAAPEEYLRQEMEDEHLDALGKQVVQLAVD